LTDEGCDSVEKISCHCRYQRSHQTDNRLELTVFLVDFYIFILLIFIRMLKAYQERINLVKFKLIALKIFAFLFETKISNSFHH